jgi:hypothetical protein
VTRGTLAGVSSAAVESPNSSKPVPAHHHLRDEQSELYRQGRWRALKEALEEFYKKHPRKKWKKMDSPISNERAGVGGQQKHRTPSVSPLNDEIEVQTSPRTALSIIYGST